MHSPSLLSRLVPLWKSVRLSNLSPNTSHASNSDMQNRHARLTKWMHSKPHVQETQSEKVMVRVFEQGRTLPHQQWILRMNAQNNYLSWCRNCYICVGGYIALTVGSSHAIIELPFDVQAQESLNDALLFLAATSMCFGTTEYVYQLIRMRTLTNMSWMMLLAYILMAILHIATFFIIFTNVYIGDDDSPDEKPSAINKSR